MTRQWICFRYAVRLVAAVLPSALMGQTAVDTAGALRAAETAAQEWLTLVDKGQFAESLEQAAIPFQLAVTKGTWEQAVKNARAPFEPFGARRRLMARYTTEIPNAPPGQYVLLQYQTSVAGGRQVVETVVPMFDAKRGWRVSGYFVRPEQ